MQRRTAEDVIAELKRRAAEGRSLGSGANRGDWLYASAVNRFGSWAAAVEAAGFDYQDIRQVPVTAERTLDRLRAVAAAGESLRATDHPNLAYLAKRHFGGWAAALGAAGLAAPSKATKWPPERVIERIRADRDAGLSIMPGAVNSRDPSFYAAARRRFGSWEEVLAAAWPGESYQPRQKPRRRPHDHDGDQ